MQESPENEVESPENETKSPKKNAVTDEDQISQSLPIVDHLPGAAPEPFPGPFPGESGEGIVAEANSVEHKDQQLSTIEEEKGNVNEVDPFESSYYLIDKLLTKLINIGIERNDCQLRRVEVLKELEKAKKLHDYLRSLNGTSVPNGAVIERQEGAYIF